MGIVSDPYSFSDPDSFDPTADSGPTREEWDDLMAWVRDHPYDDEPPELADADYYEPEPDDVAWFAAATLARPSLCRSVPPSAHGAEVDLP